MPNFWNIVNRVINEADVLVMVLDARMVSETRNIEIESKIQKLKKPLIYVLNKSDLVDENILKNYKRTIHNSIFLSAKLHQGTNKLREKIMIAASQMKKERVKVGVLGYPNVGKSSVINALKGSASAKTSSISGYTKGLQKIKTSKMMLLDTPGVIPYKEKDNLKHNMIGTIDYSKEKDPDFVVMQLMNEFPGVIEEYYGVNNSKNKEATLKAIAKKKHMLSKGSELDIKRTATMILKAFQNGKIRIK
jgi:ribosome biogenesis GTPase A